MRGTETHSRGDITAEETDEHFPVYRSRLAFGNQIQCTIERPALPLFGFPNYGSMLIGMFSVDHKMLDL